jgi:hypothetical protein
MIKNINHFGYNILFIFTGFPNYRNSKDFTRRHSAYILKTQNIAVVWQSYHRRNLLLAD